MDILANLSLIWLSVIFKNAHLHEVLMICLRYIEVIKPLKAYAVHKVEAAVLAFAYLHYVTDGH